MKFPSAAWWLVVGLGGVLVFHPGLVWAQLPTPNPLVVPPLPPPPPPQLAPITPLEAGLPSLTIIPTPSAVSSPTSAERTFNCSCFGPSSPTHWMGTVTAPSYFNAEQSATSACLAYNELKQPQPPLVATAGTTSAITSSGAAAPASAGGLNAVTGLVANQAAVASALSAGQQLPSTVQNEVPQQLRACARCACD
jgi:hypothetical protein